MIANGVARDSAEWNTVLKRLATRHEEPTAGKGKGLVADMLAAAEKGEMEMQFNLADNPLSPSVLTSTTERYPFRLVNEKGVPIPKDKIASYQGKMIPEFEVKGEWRCVTGDVDFLQISQGNGSPLSETARATVYRLMSEGPVGLLHGESATWTLRGAFDFEKKINEFKRAGTALQFAPDRVARAVRFLQADFHKGINDFRILWEGGAMNPTGAVSAAGG